jgi:Acyl-ACP thioesterase
MSLYLCLVYFGGIAMETYANLKTKYSIGLSDVDFTGTLKISALFKYFQELASAHADALGFGLDVVSANHNVTWVLVKIKVDIASLPKWNDEIEIETWPLKPKRFEFMRDYIVRDSEGNIIISAISDWVIMDITSRELRKSELIEFDMPDFKASRAIDQKLVKLRPFSEPEIAYKKTIRYSDIDINEHLTNSRYVDYIMDCFPCESHKAYRVKSIQVNFVNEALPGETINLYRDISSIDNNTLYIEGSKEESGSQIFSSVLEIVKR